MIPRAFIMEWREIAPWVEDRQVEQDLLLSRALVELYSHPIIRGVAAFRGGTALHKLYLRPALRYSEDLDLVQAETGPIGQLLDAIHECLDPWLGKPRWKRGKGLTTFYYRFDPTEEAFAPGRLKIEINTREHFSAFPLASIPYEIDSRWFTGSAEIQTYAVEELLGTKLRALYQRKKGRDLFDLWVASTRLKPDPGKIVGCCLHYLEKANLRVSRAEIEANLMGKLSDPGFLGDISPLLSPDAAWNEQEAAQWALDVLAPLFPGEPWKGREGG